MSVVTEIRKSVAEATPVMAMVGATDLAVERVRKVAAEAGQMQDELEKKVVAWQHDVEKVVGNLDPAYLQKFFTKTFEGKHFDAKTLQANAQQMPALAVSRALEMAGKVETGYESLAERGKQLVLRVEKSKATKELMTQGKATLSRSKAAVTTARHAVAETVDEAMEALHLGQHDVKEVAADVKEVATDVVTDVEQAVVAGTKTTRAAVKRTTETAKTRTTRTRTATKGAVTSARKTAAKAAQAVADVAEKIGD